VALINAAFLAAVGFDNAAATHTAAVILLVVSGLRVVEDHLVAGLMGKEPQKIQDILVQANRLRYQAGELIAAFESLARAGATPDAYPLSAAERITNDLSNLLPDLELAAD
jgi:hypothetical protein